MWSCRLESSTPMKGTWQGGTRCLPPVVGPPHEAVQVRPVRLSRNQLWTQTRRHLWVSEGLETGNETILRRVTRSSPRPRMFALRRLSFVNSFPFSRSISLFPDRIAVRSQATTHRFVSPSRADRILPREALRISQRPFLCTFFFFFFAPSSTCWKWKLSSETECCAHPLPKLTFSWNYPGQEYT